MKRNATTASQRRPVRPIVSPIQRVSTAKKRKRTLPKPVRFPGPVSFRQFVAGFR